MAPAKTCKTCLKSQLLLICSLIGIFLGVLIGFIMKTYGASLYWYMWLGLPGELFLRGLQMAIIPVIVANLIIMSSRTNIGQQGKILIVVIVYSLFIGVMGSYIGIFLTATINPGQGRNISRASNVSTDLERELGFHEMLSDLFRNIVPSNLIEACISTAVTKFKTIQSDGKATVQLYTEKSARTNLIGLMSCSVVFGLVAGNFREHTKGFLSFVEGVAIISTTILKILLKTLPVAIFSLMITAFSNMGNVKDILIGMGMFVLCVLLSLLIIQGIFHPLIYLIFIRRNPIRFLLALGKPWFMGFTVLSSMITIPELERSLIKFGLREKIVKLVIPLSLGIGSCGSIVFVASACVFIAQMNGKPLPISALISLGFLSPINVTALPAVPSASIMGIIVLLESLQSSVELVPVLFATEFILDRFRTGTNVVSIGLGCCLVEKFCTNNSIREENNKIFEKKDNGLIGDMNLTDTSDL